MPNLSPTGVYYHTAASAPITEEARSLALATSVDKAIGLVPIIPSSVTVSAGTASVSSDGIITVSAGATIAINSVFSAAYRDYKVVLDGATTLNPSEWTAMRLRSGGVDDSSASYDGIYQYSGTASSATASAGWTNETNMRPFPSGNYRLFTEMNFGSPFLVLYTMVRTQTIYDANNGLEGGQMFCQHKQNTSYTGFTFIPSSTFNGTIRVYGLR